MNRLEEYYNKFNEDKRLTSRHGIVEFSTTIKYILKALDKFKNPKVLDCGAGTGRYSVYLSNLGYDVTAVELCRPNLGMLKAKKSNVKAYLGNAIDLRKFKDNSFDVTLELGPMYHLFTEEEKIKVLQEAKRVTKPNGFIFIAYYMNDYGVIVHGFKDGFIKDAFDKGLIDKDFHLHNNPEDLYDFVRLEDIDELNKKAEMTRYKILAQDGPTDYMRKEINSMDEETFNLFIKYLQNICERKDMLGCSSHLLDILINKK